MKKKESNKLITVIAVLILFFLILSQIEFIKIPYLGGPKYLALRDNYIDLNLNIRSKTIDLFFKDPIKLGKNHKLFSIENDKKTEMPDSSFKVYSSNDRKVIKIEMPNNTGPTLEIIINFQDLFLGGMPKKKMIKQIDVDGKEISITKFYNSYLEKDQSNVIYYKLFAIKNISSAFAEVYSIPIIGIVGLVLFYLLLMQFLSIFLTFIDSYFPVNKIGVGKDAVFPLSLIDKLSDEYSVGLGFFGTVLSIWSALEIQVLDYSDFGQVLDVMKMAIFTTVMGLGIKILFTFKREFHNFLKEKNNASTTKSSNSSS